MAAFPYDPDTINALPASDNETEGVGSDFVAADSGGHLGESSGFYRGATDREGGVPLADQNGASPRSEAETGLSVSNPIYAEEMIADHYRDSVRSQSVTSSSPPDLTVESSYKGGHYGDNAYRWNRENYS
ncbi:MAG TPA: hypothetical protein V6C46_04320, partial [Coleofasciculaceae cyanobacterium]